MRNVNRRTYHYHSLLIMALAGSKQSLFKTSHSIGVEEAPTDSQYHSSRLCRSGISMLRFQVTMFSKVIIQICITKCRPERNITPGTYSLGHWLVVDHFECFICIHCCIRTSNPLVIDIRKAYTEIVSFLQIGTMSREAEAKYFERHDFDVLRS